MTIANVMADVLDPKQAELIEWPVKTPLEGNPRAAYCVIGRSDDRRTLTGIWECSPGKFWTEYTWDETIYVLEGRVTLQEDDGPSREFKAGDVVHFPIGLKCTWTAIPNSPACRHVRFTRASSRSWFLIAPDVHGFSSRSCI